jgi:hypothetical protein
LRLSWHFHSKGPQAPTHLPQKEDDNDEHEEKQERIVNAAPAEFLQPRPAQKGGVEIHVKIIE